jgi:O-antigen/teichoic acid export membrane protein
MPALVLFLVFCQALGATVGAFTAVWAELSFAKAVRRGKIDTAEREHLLVIGHGLRYGMSLLLLASLGLLIVAYVERATQQPALSASYWVFIALALLIISVSSALARHRASFKLASASLFTAWWFLVFLSFGWLSLSFGAAVMSFVVATAIFYAVLHFSRILVRP